MTANVDSETGQRVYVPEFLKLLTSPPSPSGPELKPGWRKVSRLGTRCRREVSSYPRPLATGPALERSGGPYL